MTNQSTEEIEYVHEIDEQDKVLRTVTHDEMRKENLRHREVITLIIDQKDNFLVQKRAKGKLIYPGYYQSGAGGCVRAGENYQDAAARELNEELSIDNVRLNFLFDFTFSGLFI